MTAVQEVVSHHVRPPRISNTVLSDTIIKYFLENVPVASGGINWHSARAPYGDGRSLAVTVMASSKKEENSLAIVLLSEPGAEGYQSLERVSGRRRTLVDMKF